MAVVRGISFRFVFSVLTFYILGTSSYAIEVDRYKDRLDIPAEVSSLATKSPLFGITRAGSNYVAVGEHGHILHSADKGQSWVQSVVPLSSPLLAVSFPTPSKGWAVGHDGVILHSTDGGKNWVRKFDGREVGAMMEAWYTKQPKSDDPKIINAREEAGRFQREGASKPFFDVYFESEKSGWVVGSFNLILKTDDGGTTWEPWLHRTENPSGYSLHAISVADGDVYIVGELGLVLRLDRAKNSFVALKTPYKGSFFGVTGKPGLVLVYGLRGNLFRSRDKGDTWQALKQDMEAALVGGCAIDDGSLVLVSNAGHLMLSRDDGTTFYRVPAVTSEFLSAVAPVDGKSVIVVGARGVRIQQLNQ